MSSEPHPDTGQPVGPVVDATPAGRPQAVKLTGRFGHVERLKAEHAPALWEGLKDHIRVWTYMPSYGPFTEAGPFSHWIAQRAALEDPYCYVAIDKSGTPRGILALMALRTEHRVCEIGHILYTPALQRTPLATEAQYLVARYAFETLRYRRYEWKCDALNAPSRRAALRFGLTFEGIFRQHMIARGRNRNSAWYAMTDDEWPSRKAAFERWLAPENFAADGNQRQSLSALNGVRAAPE